MAEVTMKTYYKPSQWRGKRMIFESLDPAERKERAVRLWIAVSLLILLFGLVVWLSR